MQLVNWLSISTLECPGKKLATFHRETSAASDFPKLGGAVKASSEQLFTSVFGRRV